MVAKRNSSRFCIDKWRLCILSCIMKNTEKKKRFNLFITLPLYYTHGWMLKTFAVVVAIRNRAHFACMHTHTRVFFARSSAYTIMVLYFWITHDTTKEKKNRITRFRLTPKIRPPRWRTDRIKRTNKVTKKVHTQLCVWVSSIISG